MLTGSWRTSLAGLVAGLGTAVDALLSAYNAGAFTGKTGIQLVIAIAIILWGLYSKDKSVTGGTIINPNATIVASSSIIPVAEEVEPSQTL